MEQLILIHGALGRASEFDKVIPILKNKFRIITYEIPHHGTLKESSTPFEINDLTKHFIDFINTVGPSYVYGFSLGGYIALAAAQKEEHNFKGIVTQGTKLNWSREESLREVETLNINFISTKSKVFYNYLSELHGAYLPQLLTKTADFMTQLGAAPLITPKSVSHLSIPIRFTRGGKDKMVTQKETIEIAHAIDNTHYTEVPSMIHPVGFIKPKYIARLISTQIKSMNFQWAKTSSFGKMAYQQYGEIQNEEQPLLLFLHESLGSIAQWKSFPKDLCQQLKLPGIALEFPGYGFSDPENKVRDNKYLHEFSWDVLPAFLETINLKNPLILIGHSDGGTNALLYSSKFPGQVKGVVTMAAHYINEDKTRAGIRPAIEAFNQGKLKGLELFHGEKTERLFFAWCKTWLLPEFKNWDISKDIENNKVPALIIQGDKDQYGTDQQVNGIVNLLENASSYFISDCGHSPHLEKEKEVIEAIEEWKFTEF